MGCWNGSCALTGLPVHAGDAVRVFLLIQREYPGDNCYPDSYWAPLHYHFKGKYDDYGGVDDCTGLMIPSILETICEYLVEMEQGDNEYHDIPVKAEGFDLTKLFEAAHESRLYLKSPYYAMGEPNAKFRVQHIMIHEYVFAELLNRYSFDGWSRGVISYEAIVKEGLALIEAARNPSTEPDLKKAAKIAKLIEDGVSAEKAEAVYEILLEAEIDRRGGSDMKLLSNIEGCPRYGTYNHPISDLRAAIKSKDYVMATELVEQIAAMVMMTSYMSGARRMWSPMSGSGSQDSETTTQTLMATLTQEMAHTIDHRWDE